MPLQRKFALLLGVLIATLAINVGCAWWAVRVLEREQAGPLRNTAAILQDLQRTKRAVEEQSRLLEANALTTGRWHGAPVPLAPEPADLAQQLAALGRVIDDAATRLEANETFQVRAHASTGRNLADRVGRSRRLAAECQAASRVGATTSLAGWSILARITGESLGQNLFEAHELIERIEKHVVDDANLAVAHAREVRGGVRVTLGASIGMVLLSGALLGPILIRRWIIQPVASLREAAARISSGDFAYRTPVVGSDEIAQLSSEVNHMASMVLRMQEERVDRERLAAVGEMVRRIVHNLRNPLAGIRGLAELTRSGLTADDPHREAQSRIITSVDTFDSWLTDLLRATGRLRVEPVPVEIRGWLGPVVESHRAMAEARGVVLELDAGSSERVASFDPKHLEQAVVAILANAIQASPEKGRVRVQARWGDNGHWQIRVSDQGPGVPAEMAESIFRPYFTTKRNGTGIGLALAKSIVEQHAGTIGVESGDMGVSRDGAGPGSCFVITLQVETPQPVVNAGQNFGQVGSGSGKDPDHRG